MRRPKAPRQARKDIETLKPIIEMHGAKGEELRHLPSEIAEAFVERGIYVCCCPMQHAGRCALGMKPYSPLF